MAANSETGAQLFARLGEKCSLEGLDSHLIPTSATPRPGDILEIYGSSGSGKTEALLNLAANCILPETWNGVHIGGLGTSVVFVDTDYQFSMLRLFTILERRVARALMDLTQFGNGCGESPVRIGGTDGDVCLANAGDQAAFSSRHPQSDPYQKLDDGGPCTKKDKMEEMIFPDSEESRKIDVKPVANAESMSERTRRDISAQPSLPSDEDVESFIKDCLKKLFVIRIATSAQLVVTLHSLEALLASNPDVSVMMIDSVSAFYWVDRMQGDGAHPYGGANQKLAFAVLSKLIHDYHLVLFATKPDLITKHQSEFTSRLNFADDVENRRSKPSPSARNSTLTISTEHHEFMGKDWASLVTHRMILERQDRASGDGQRMSSFLSVLKDKKTGSVNSCRFSVDVQGIVHC